MGILQYKNEIDAILQVHSYTFETALHNGLANVIMKVRDRSGMPLVVKYYPRNSFKMEREKMFVNLAQNVLSVPQIINAGENYLVMNYIEGESGTTLFSHPQTISYSIGQKVGEKIRALHCVFPDIAVIGFLGRDFVSEREYDLKLSRHTSNTQFLRDLLKEQITHLTHYGFSLPDIDLSAIAVKEDNERVLIHHDLCLKNILFKNEKIMAFLDFEYAMVGSRLFDLAKLDILGMYLAYHTGGVGRYLDFLEYKKGFYEKYGDRPSEETLQPFYLYIILNYILFWLSSATVSDTEKQKILPIHYENLNRIIRKEQLTVPQYS